MARARGSLSLVLLGASLAGCPSGTPAQKLQPTVPTVATADRGAKPRVEACQPGSRHDVMVVDWTPEARGDLEVAMKEGVALLAYDCTSARLVPECSLDGSYGFIGTTRRDKRIELSTADEIAANLPVGGLSWLSDLGGKVGRERALVAELVMIGKRTSAKKVIARGDLQGSCDGVTHFVRASTVGAFVVAAGSKAELSGGLKLVGKGASASSTSSTKIEAKDGDLAACEGAGPDAKAPPAQCGAVVRIELAPIVDGDPAAGAAPPALAVAACAPGFAMADGACVRLDKPHQCQPGDAAECAAQCEAGNAGSCATLAALHREGDGVAKDWAKAATLAARACDGDVIAGCRMLAAAKLGGEGTRKDEPGAIALLDRACQAGDGAGCVELGVARLADKKLAGDAQYAFRRACYGGGEVEGCAWLGALYAEGKGGLRKNPKLAVPFFEKGCKDGSLRACAELGKLLKTGKGVAKDAARGAQLRERACNGGYAPACK